jgi:hypothetical protein
VINPVLFPLGGYWDGYGAAASRKFSRKFLMDDLSLAKQGMMKMAVV